MNLDKIKPVFKCPEEFKKEFHASRCLLTISVGQEVHEGEKFYKTIDLVNLSFKECIILVDDSLQRHSMRLNTNLSDKEAYRISLNEGDLWLKRNEAFYKKLSIPFKIIRWNKWLHHPNYKRQREKIDSLYTTNSSYRESVHSSIQEFLDRYVNREEKVDTEKGFNLCLEYLKEECTALCLWVEEECHFEVYPSKRNEVMSATHETFVKPYYPNLLHPVAIKFKNRKQLSPQKFNNNVKE